MSDPSNPGATGGSVEEVDGTREEVLEGLCAEIRVCHACPLGQTRTTAVPGEGPSAAQVMCIGEAPGMNEDRQGRPFVGAAGKFLEECLGRAGFGREDVYICNVLKCRPPNNRDPMPEEIGACSSFLERQLDIVNPLVVVTLGRFSMGRFFPGRAISRVHGRWKEHDGRFFVPMYHPAAALHQGGLRNTILDDFAGLPRVIERARQARLMNPSGAGQAGGDGLETPDPENESHQISLFE